MIKDNGEDKEIVLGETKATMFDKIKWFIKDARYWPNTFMTGVKNLIKWFPIIWKDRDWDDHYIFEVLKFKIENTAKHIGGNDRHTTAKRDAEIMMTVVRLIEHLQKETYNMEYLDYHKSKHKFVPTEIEGRKCYEWVEEEISENFDEYFAKYPRQYKRVLNGQINMFDRGGEEKSKQLIAMEISHENQKRCKRLLFKILEEHIEGWWD